MQVLLTGCAHASDIELSGVRAFSNDPWFLKATFDNIAACDKAKFATGWEQSGPLELSCQKEALCGGVIGYPCDNGEDIVHYTRVVYSTAESGVKLMGLSWVAA